MIKIIQSGLFSRSIKRLHPNEKEKLDSAVMALIDNPELGDSSCGTGFATPTQTFKVSQVIEAYKRFSRGCKPRPAWG